MPVKKEIKKYTGEIPCCCENIWNDGVCDIESDWQEEHDCSPECPDYKPMKIMICKKHNCEYVENCGECESEYWDNLGRKLDRQMILETWCQLHLRFTFKISTYDRYGGNVNSNKLKGGIVDKYDMQGKRLFRGLFIYLLNHSLILRIYCKGEADYEQIPDKYK
jgi:hypothetical protein